MNPITSMLCWWRQRKINRLLQERAGLLSERRLMMSCGTFYPAIINRLGEIDEHLHQLGWRALP